ncbi:MAG: glycosyltransferase family 2 protein [Clostridia bacterium]|nr:glycosyltransferase family 2 protein [Clostridia bacterium]
MAKVTIIVPIYNVEKYLRKCLDSLINQKFKDIEIWAISDGSPDNSVDIIKEYQERDSRVKCIEKENGGYGSVLEYAIQNITTPYFLICDPDDWISEDAVEVLYNTMIDNNLDFVRASYYNVYSNNMEMIPQEGFSYPDIFKPEEKKVYSGDDAKMFLFMSDSPHSKMFKTEIAKTIEFPHHVSFTDGILYKMYISKADKVMFINKLLSYYLIDREGNTFTDIKPKIADQHFIVFQSIFDQYDKCEQKTDLLCFRNFLQCKYVNIEIARIREKDVYNNKKQIIYKMYKKCRKYNKQINKCLLLESNKERLAYRLLLNPITSKIAFEYFSNKIWKEQNHK